MAPSNNNDSGSMWKQTWAVLLMRRKLICIGMGLHLIGLVSMHHKAMSPYGKALWDSRKSFALPVVATTDSSTMAMLRTGAITEDSKPTAKASSDTTTAGGTLARGGTDQQGKQLRRSLTLSDRTTSKSSNSVVPAVVTESVARDTRKDATRDSFPPATASKAAAVGSSNNKAPLSTEDELFAYTPIEAPECTSVWPGQVSYTLVMQCDDKRVPMIAQHCQRWQGPISVAILSERTPDEITAELVSLNCTQEQLTVGTLLTTDYDLDSFPVNHLRNLAIQNAETTHIVYLDVDFLPNDNLENTLRSRTFKSEVGKDPKLALVIPAFEYKPACGNCSTPEELLANMPRFRKDLLQLKRRGEASMFHEYWPVAHDSTNYKAWKKQAFGSLRPIPCIKANNYEPYLVLRKCEALPPFQEAFVGYGYNKASFTMQLQAMQYKFSQIGGVFCTHFPHEESKARKVFDQTKTPTVDGKRRDIMKLVLKFKAWLNESYGYVEPVVPYCDALAVNGTAFIDRDDDIDSNETFEFFGESEDLGECTDVSPANVTYSIVTQCSDDRLWMMEHHCQRWAVNNSKPFISLVVYTNDTVTQVKKKLRSLKCPVDKSMSVQVFPKDTFADKDYPVNYIRNLALAAVKTTHAIVLDIDFWPSTDLFSTLNTLPVRTKLSESVQQAAVVPAFQLHPQCDMSVPGCMESHTPLIPSVRDHRMMSSLENGSMTVFNIRENYHGHGSTRYDKWVNQSVDEVHDIDCVYSGRYEPYLVVRACRELPPFQPVFTGYGKNKISWIIHLRRFGYKFSQLGQAFVVHYPHPESSAKVDWKKVPDRLFRPPSKEEAYRDTSRVLNERRYAAFQNWMTVSVPDRTQVAKCVFNPNVQDNADDDDSW